MFRKPRPGDLLRSTKQWFWQKRRMDRVYLNQTMELGYVYAPYVPAAFQTMPSGQTPGLISRFAKRLNRALEYSDIPVGEAFMVLAFDDLTMLGYYEDHVYSVTAACIEHVLNDFELLSELE